MDFFNACTAERKLEFRFYYCWYLLQTYCWGALFCSGFTCLLTVFMIIVAYSFKDLPWLQGDLRAVKVCFALLKHAASSSSESPFSPTVEADFGPVFCLHIDFGVGTIDRAFDNSNRVSPISSQKRALEDSLHESKGAVAPSWELLMMLLAVLTFTRRLLPLLMERPTATSF